MVTGTSWVDLEMMNLLQDFSDQMTSTQPLKVKAGRTSFDQITTRRTTNSETIPWRKVMNTFTVTSPTALDHMVKTSKVMVKVMPLQRLKLNCFGAMMT